MIGPKLNVLLEPLHADIAKILADFERDFRGRLDQARRDEVERAERRLKIEGRNATELRRRRKKIRPAVAPWESQNWQLPEPAVPENVFGPAALLERLTPRLCQFAKDVMTYERAIVTGLPRRKKMAHLSRALQAIWQLIAPDTIRQNTLAHPEGWHFAPGTIDVGPFEFRTDARGNVIDLRRALHAERRGVFANLPLGEAWGLLQIPLLRGLLQHDIIPVLQSQVVEITDDRRTRKEILDDCKRLHGLTNKAICQEAQVLESELYRWAQDDKAPRPIKNTSAPHRRLIMVLTSPVRPRVLPLL